MSEIPHFKVAIHHLDFPDEAGPKTVEISVPAEKEFTGISGVDDLLLEAKDAAVTALKRAAGNYLVDYDSFGNDSQYLNRIDEVVAEMTVLSITLSGEPRRYSVTGIYSDEGGDWSDWVYAIHDAEAEFQAKWTMAENQGEGGGPSGEDIEDFIDTMDDIKITYFHEEPVTKDEYRDAFRKLVEEAIAAGHSGPALDDAIAKLQSDGVEIAVPSAPAL